MAVQVGLRTERIEKLASNMRVEGVRAFVLSSPVNMGYLHGFTEGGGERFLTLSVRDDGAVRMVCPALSENQARRCGSLRTCQTSSGALGTTVSRRTITPSRR